MGTKEIKRNLANTLFTEFLLFIAKVQSGFGSHQDLLSILNK